MGKPKVLRAVILATLLTAGMHTLMSQNPLPPQTTNGPCSPIFNGSGNTNICPPAAPPGRVIYLSAARTAIDILSKAPAGSKVQVVLIGQSKEIDGFAGIVMSLFREANWKVLPPFRIGRLSWVDGQGNAWNGEGVRCHSVEGNPNAVEAATAAMTVAGYPCTEAAVPPPMPDTPKENIPDFYVTVGTRILPD